ncbi:MAG TPA: hypothetical protein VMF13_05905 [Luteitalea sp.]|nr:hypothetical protein [Luteitalea sp.]
MDESRHLLRHYLAVLAYRTQKAVRDAPTSFGSFEAGAQVRTPAALVRHMAVVLDFARSCYAGGRETMEPLADLAAELTRFHRVLEDLSAHLATDAQPSRLTEAQLLQGPFADAMTHAGQLALLRRLAGAPVRPESFVEAAIDVTNVSETQPLPVRPAANWPEAPSA